MSPGGIRTSHGFNLNPATRPRQTRNNTKRYLRAMARPQGDCQPDRQLILRTRRAQVAGILIKALDVEFVQLAFPG